MSVRGTSVEAHRSILPTLNARQTAVLELLRASQWSLTNKEIAEKLGWPINTVTPRTGELVAFGLVHDAGTRRDPKTGRKAHTWAAGAGAPPAPKMVPREVEVDGVRMIRSVPESV